MSLVFATFTPFYIMKNQSEGIRNFSIVYCMKNGCSVDFIIELMCTLEQSSFSIIRGIRRLIIQQTDCHYVEVVPKEF
jgi:hypothetical protein